MNSVTTPLDRVKSGFPLGADDGMTVTADIPAGCVLRKSVDLQSWQAVAYSGPFQHSGARAAYRIDCVTYGGTPVTATLEIV